MRPRNSMMSCACVICGCCLLLLTAMPVLYLFADDSSLPVCNGEMMGNGTHECLPFDMSGCTGRAEPQCKARPCGDAGMIRYIESINEIGACVFNKDSWTKQGHTTGCYDFWDDLICYKVYACMWDAQEQACVPFTDILCENVVIPYYPANLPCKVGSTLISSVPRRKGTDTAMQYVVAYSTKVGPPVK